MQMQTDSSDSKSDAGLPKSSQIVDWMAGRLGDVHDRQHIRLFF